MALLGIVHVRWRTVGSLSLASFIIFSMVTMFSSHDSRNLPRPVNSFPVNSFTQLSNLSEKKITTSNKPADNPVTAAVPKPEPLQLQQPKPEADNQQNDVPVVKTIMYMEGWMHYDSFYNGEFNLYLDLYSERECGHLCVSTRTGEMRFAAADVVVFQPSTLRLNPPKKHKHQYWILHSFEVLQDRQMEYLYKRGYTDLIDQYMIRPENVITPLAFSTKVHSVNNGLYDDMRLMNYFNRHPLLKIGQVVSSCEILSDSAYELKLENPLGRQLKQFASEVGLVYINSCYEIEPPMHLPLDATFVILDESDCQNSLLEQFSFIQRSNTDAIPIVPSVSAEVLNELSSLAPPHSFISMSGFDDLRALLQHLKDVRASSELFLGYHKWRGTYTLDTDVGECGNLLHCLLHMNSYFWRCDVLL